MSGSAGGGFVIDTATVFVLLLGLLLAGVGIWRLSRRR
jgi:hypothetical protein